jgi:hypothetical protein
VKWIGRILKDSTGESLGRIMNREKKCRPRYFKGYENIPYKQIKNKGPLPLPPRDKYPHY